MGNNSLKSETNVTINVGNNNAVTIEGSEEDSTLEVYGGYNGGEGNLIPTSDRAGINGGYAIGFTTTTSDPTSIEIKDSINVMAYGGQGQNTDAKLLFLVTILH